jgi:indole-3-acetate monooxygenase
MTDTVGRMLADIRAFAPGIPARAAEIEAARQMPQDIVEALNNIGIFRMFAPRSHGGMELDFPSGMKVVTELENRRIDRLDRDDRVGIDHFFIAGAEASLR